MRGTSNWNRASASIRRLNNPLFGCLVFGNRTMWFTSYIAPSIFTPAAAARASANVRATC